MLDDTTVRVASCIAATCALALGCRRAPERIDREAVAVVGESTRLRLEDPWPASTPWFDGGRLTLIAARGETLGIQILHPSGESVRLVIAGGGVQVAGYAVDVLKVKHPSTALYGGSHGAGTYADGLVPAPHPASNPAYFELTVAPDADPGLYTGQLAVGPRRYAVTLEVAHVTLPALGVWVWAYEDPRELASEGANPNAAERECIALFRKHGVVLSPDLPVAWWPARRDLLAGVRDIPAVIAGADDVRAWIAATRGTSQVPFAIPIDEPLTADARRRVRALAEQVRAAGGGPTTFRFAVTDAPHSDYGDLVDLYISWRAAHLTGDRGERWTYNGAPPYAGSLVLDAETPGTRTWGWIGWRWNIPVWYVWDALYWHDRHNKRRALDLADPVSFDDGEDHGNLDGVLALPGCKPTLRLAALRRGLYDRALLDRAARCAPEATARLAAHLVPRALGDATGKAPSWTTDEAAWELARRQLIALASCP